MSVKFWLERLALFLSLFVTLGTFSYADNTGVVPPPAGTPLVSGTPFQTVTQAMDKYGQAYVVPGPSGTPGTFPVGGTVNVVATPGATSFLKQEDVAATDGHYSIAPLSQRSDTQGSTANTNGDYAGIISDSSGGVWVSVYGNSRADNPFKLEDAAATSSDALVGIAGRINTAFNVPAANLDYTYLSLGQYGQAHVTQEYDDSMAQTIQTVGREDLPSDVNEAGTKILVVTQDPLSVDQGASGDLSFAKVDRAGRTITTLAPAGETWQACSAYQTGTSNEAIKAAVASNRIYVTSLSCHNKSATTGSVIVVKDGTVAMVDSYLGPTTIANNVWNVTFPVPLRGSVNTALNFSLATTSTDTLCCASGYISVN